VTEPRDLRSRDGILTVDLSIHDEREPDGSVRYCYLLADGTQSPTLRLHPGDILVLRLKDDLSEPGSPAMSTAVPSPGMRMGLSSPEMPSTRPRSMRTPMPGSMQMPMPMATRTPLSATSALSAAASSDPCTRGEMSPTATNLHFHGLSIAAVCHEDDVLTTSIRPSDPPFLYRFRIPRDEPPGLYWYHPHIHGFSSREVLGGASGALIVEGIERANPAVAGLPERVIVIRDQDLLNPHAPPSKSEPVVPKRLMDRDGDSANNGTGFGPPAKDLSVNFVPVPYPDYPPARLPMRPRERQLWRVLNASAVTYLNLALLMDRAPQRLGVVAIDGVPLTVSGGRAPSVAWVDHVGIPPGARAEFIVTGPPAGGHALLVTRAVDTGAGGENDPNRRLALITADRAAPEPRSRLPAAHDPPWVPARPWLGDVPPVRVRKLYFSEKLENPRDPASATTFYLTVDGEKPASFDPHSTAPNIVVRQGEVEDWIIENRSAELHAFHIHQIHFALIDWLGVPVHEPFLRDTINVPYYDGRMLQYPSVRLRMDFRGPRAVGTYVYHCHLLEHEDGGMMGVLRVLPRETGSPREGTVPAPR